MPANIKSAVSFYPPPSALRQYFTTFYHMEIAVPDGKWVEDFVHPEWGGLRMIDGVLPDGAILGGPSFSGIANAGQGPTSTAIHFRIGSCRAWGIGILPAGWAKFISCPANDLANMVFDAATHPAFAPLAPLTRTVFDGASDPPTELARIVEHFMGLLDRPSPDEHRIIAIHQALVDPDIAHVQEMVDRTGFQAYTLERLCKRHFGFAPSLLLRRQRFMRSLVQYVLAQPGKWMDAIDPHYHDQAQFVRDFHRFMGMSPREYAATPHPILEATMHARISATGAAVQTLHLPIPPT